MKRRDFVKGMLGGTGALAGRPEAGRAFQAPSVSTDVKQVLVMFKCHLDVGFIDTQAGIVHKYFQEYFPQAMEVATAMRQRGKDRYIWTTGSWLLYEYLEHSSGEERRRVEQAVAAGDLAWHALPFTWQTEFLDRSMIEGAIGLSQSLDQRFGCTTIGAKMTDVPGHSRGLVAPLAAGGVKLLDIGQNGRPLPPQLPTLFVWKNPEGASLTVIHHKSYGGLVQVPDSDLAVVISVLGDNKGPHSVEEVTGPIQSGGKK